MLQYQWAQGHRVPVPKAIHKMSPSDPVIMLYLKAAVQTLF